MAETRINGSSSKNNYGFYAIVQASGLNQNNKIPVVVNLYVQNNGTRFNSSNWTINITADGQNFNYTGVSLNSTSVGHYSSLLVKTISLEVEPTKSSISVSASISKISYSSYDPGYCSLSGTATMPQISSTWGVPILSLENIENSFNLSINKYVSNYTNKVTISNLQNTTIVKTIENAQNGDTVQFTSDELSQIYTLGTNSQNQVLRFYMNLYTYDGTTLIGEYQRLVCDAGLTNAEPSATYTVQEQNDNVIAILGEDSDSVINQTSNLLFTITPQAKKGATISKITINSINVPLVENVYKLALNGVTTGTYNLSVIDSRNYETKYTITKTLIPYQPISINSIDFQRRSQTSNKILLTSEIYCFSGSFESVQNTPSVYFKIGSGSYVEITDFTFSNNKITFYNYELSQELSYQEHADVYLKVNDLLTSDEENRAVNKGIATFEAGEHDFQINGDLFIADTERQNKVNVKNMFAYSNDEIEVGTFLNKKLYRRVFTQNINSKQTDIIVSNSVIANLDTICSIRGTLKSAYNNTLLIPYLNPNGNQNEGISLYYHSTNGLTLRIGNIIVSNSPLVIIVEYTKK